MISTWYRQNHLRVLLKSKLSNLIQEIVSIKSIVYLCRLDQEDLVPCEVCKKQYSVYEIHDHEV